MATWTSRMAMAAASGLVAAACGGEATPEPETPASAESAATPPAPVEGQAVPTDEGAASEAAAEGEGAEAAGEAAGEKACCKGMNECKGKGGCHTDSHTCSGKNECKGKGGCKANCPK